MTKERMIDLRPCPFCGDNVRLEDREFDDFAGSFFTNTMFVIECEKCGVSMKRYPKRGYGTTDEQKQDLINSWNRRTEVMLKEQEPVKPNGTREAMSFAFNGMLTGYCPRCGTIVNSIGNSGACGKCGQKFDWE